MDSFGDYESKAADYITVQPREFYPDYLKAAVLLYGDQMVRFGELIEAVSSSADLLRAIMQEPGSDRIQLLRLFRKYVSPDTSVEMLKVKSKTENVIATFGASFRSYGEVLEAFRERNQPDESLAAILWEHHDRGTRGYELTSEFFDWFEERFGNEYYIEGPRRAGQDVGLSQRLPKFYDEVPADFVIFRTSDDAPLVVGFAHYDSDRGGSQEDDRTAGNQDKVNKIMEYASRRRIPLKVLFINDGPGLLLGSMWRDYAKLESANMVDGEMRVLVCTLELLPTRLTKRWLEE